jgi:hypothetical protein
MEIELTKGHITKVDKEDYEKFSQNKWCSNKKHSHQKEF